MKKLNIYFESKVEDPKIKVGHTQSHNNPLSRFLKASNPQKPQESQLPKTIDFLNDTER